MVAEFKVNPRLTAKIAEIYNRLDSKIRGKLQSAQKCSSCGKWINRIYSEIVLKVSAALYTYPSTITTHKNIIP